MADDKIVYSVTLKLEKTFEIPVSVSKDELIDVLVNKNQIKEAFKFYNSQAEFLLALMFPNKDLVTKDFNVFRYLGDL